MSWAVPRAPEGGLTGTIATLPYVLAAISAVIVAIALAAALGLR
jgi:hypothetical protein